MENCGCSWLGTTNTACGCKVENGCGRCGAIDLRSCNTREQNDTLKHWIKHQIHPFLT